MDIAALFRSLYEGQESDINTEFLKTISQLEKWIIQIILLHWCLKNITFKKYKLIDLVNIMLLTAHHQNEKTQMTQYVASHGTTALTASTSTSVSGL